MLFRINKVGLNLVFKALHKCASPSLIFSKLKNNNRNKEQNYLGIKSKKIMIFNKYGSENINFKNFLQRYSNYLSQFLGHYQFSRF